MNVLDTNVVPELMKSAPEPAVMVWINALPGSAVFISAITQAETLYGVALVPEGKRREGLARAARTASETYFRGHVLPFDSEAAEAFAALAAGRRRAGRPISQADAQIAESPDPAERLLPPAMCRILRGAGSKSSTLGVRRRDTSQADQLKTEDRLPWRRPANNANAEVVGLECMPDVSPRPPRPSKINGFAGKAPKRVTAIRWATAA
jgi:predicted nucleic acid-binding protein